MGCLLASSRAPEAGWALLEETHPYCITLDELDGFRGGAIDLDQDGFPELLAGGEAEANRGRIVVAPGFDIPWTDDTRW
jgi:hypothetical protein